MHLILTLCLSLSPQTTSQGPPEPEPSSGGRTPLPPADELQVGASTPRGSLVLWRSPNPPAGYRSTPWFVRPESAAASWRDEDPYPTPTSWMASAVMGERLYVFGGWNIVSGHARIVTSYAPGRGWRSEATMLAARSNAVAGVLGGMAYVCGGRTSANTFGDVQRFDPTSGSWTYVDSMPEPRSYAGGGVAGGRLWVVGGLDATNARRSSVFRYDPVADDWLSIYKQLEEPRAGAASVVLGDWIYLLGGGDASSAVTNRVTIYDTSTGDTWEGAPAPVAFLGGVAVVVDDEIYVTFQGSPSSAPEAYGYDTLTGAWRSVLPPRNGHSYGAAEVLADRVHVVGGLNGTYSPVHESWVVDRTRLYVMERE